MYVSRISTEVIKEGLDSDIIETTAVHEEINGVYTSSSTTGNNFVALLYM